MRHLAGNARHLEHVLVALATEAVAMQCFIGHGERVECAFDVSNGSMQVDWLDGVAGNEVDDVKDL